MVSAIWKDEDMPTDDYGIRADIIMNSSAVFNRMNTSQWTEQDVNRTDYFVINHMKTLQPLAAFEYLAQYLSFVNPKWGELCRKIHSTDTLKTGLVQEVLEKGIIYKQVSPFQTGIDEHFTLELGKRYPHGKTPVTFSVYDNQGVKHTVRTINPVCIGDEYIYLLYKTPHLASAGVAYVNQFHTPIRPSTYGRLQYPFSQTPIRLGEDEGRNITMVAGAKTMARILGMYANSSKAVNNMEEHLINDAQPSKLIHTDMDTEEIVSTNSIIGVAKHTFSCLGIDIAPSKDKIEEFSMELPEVEDKDE